MKEEDRIGIVGSCDEARRARKARRDGPLPDTEEIPFLCVLDRAGARSLAQPRECVYMCNRVQEGKEDRIEQGLQGGEGGRNGNDRWKGEPR